MQSLSLWRLWTMLGWLEIRQRYTRSSLGPFWLTLSMGILVGTLSIIYGTLFGQDLSTYLPMVAIGIVCWTLFATIVSEGCTIYISNSNYIKQINTPRLIFIFQVMWRNITIFCHNFLIIIIVLAYSGIKDFLSTLLFFGGLLLLIVNAGWVAAISGIISARFRDFPQMVNAILQITFYITPILFESKMLGKFYWIATYNPLAHVISLVRDPLIGLKPDPISWIIVFLMAIAGWLFVLFFLGRYHKRIPYWV